MKKTVVFALGVFVGAVLAGGSTIASFVNWYFHERSEAPTVFKNAILANVPFEGDWLVSWGGENKRNNQPHFGISPQNLAVDIRKIIEGSGGLTMSGDPKKNESYGCWAQPIYSPVDGVIAVSVDGVPDNIPGDLNHYSSLGNFVFVKSNDGFVVALCHFKQGSIAKRAGQPVSAGELLGLCGNSGRSTEPHLHMHAQSETNMDKSAALRLVFPAITIGTIPKKDYSPKKGDVISNKRNTTN